MDRRKGTIALSKPRGVKYFGSLLSQLTGFAVPLKMANILALFLVLVIGSSSGFNVSRTNEEVSADSPVKKSDSDKGNAVESQRTRAKFY